MSANLEEPKNFRTSGEAVSELPWLEWVASGTGLILAIGLFGLLAWEAISDTGAAPVVTVKVESVSAVEGGYRVMFRARNATQAAAAQVEIEGILSGAGNEKETSRALFDYVPGRSEREGGLFFTRDPASGSLVLRAVGFARP
jgi:uncharacterized protein (TIGR02588 family)